ncbi:MAG TPA: pseudouridine synthase [Ignavibacteriaceae bacterium]|nr:pseudouridine synthase [Ignavibacteriaceae bacterium]
MNFKYYKFNKPYEVLSQFKDKLKRKTLGLYYNFPKDVYSIGRLDYDSEGLLLLTNNKEMMDYLLNPVNKHEKEYLVQVEGIPDENKLNNLRKGVLIKGIRTYPAKVKIIADPGFPPRVPPIRYRKNIPTTWLSIIITEGKYRQVRKMTASIGHPTLRLIRVRIKEILLNGLKPGEVQELSQEEIIKLMN